MTCPTLQRLLELERDNWFAIPNNKPSTAETWEKWSQAISNLLCREDLENYLLPDPKIGADS